MNTTEPIAYINNPKRLAILNAATEEFHTSGFSGTSMDRIAEVANVSKRTVYNHFPSKDDLFQAIIDELVRKIGEMPYYEYSSKQPLKPQLERIVEAFTRTITAREFVKLSRVVVSHFISHPKWGSSTYDQHNIPIKNLIDWLTAANQDGRLSINDPERAATHLYGMIKELVYWPELMWGQAPATTNERKDAIQSSVAIFLNHFSINHE